MDLMEQPRMGGISGSTLKKIAMGSMLLDHLGVIILMRELIRRGMLEAMTDSQYLLFLEANAGLNLAYTALRLVGRIAFPIFCFLAVQGFLHTHSLKRYLGRLLLFALLSELPFDLALTGELFYWGYQNVFFTLLLGILALAGIRAAEEKQEWHVACRVLLGLLAVGLCAGAALLLQTDYDASGVLAIAVLYLFRKRRLLAAALGCVALLEVTAFASLLPIHWYNGTRGSGGKWVFYAFYPAHILLLYLIACALGLGQVAIPH